MRIVLVSLASLLTLGCVKAAVETVNADVVIDSVERNIDLSSQLVKINAKLKLTNNGPGAIKSFHYAVDPSAKETLAFIGATVSFIFKTSASTSLHDDSFSTGWK